MADLTLTKQAEEYTAINPYVTKWLALLEQRRPVFEEWDVDEQLEWINKDPLLKLALDTMLTLEDLLDTQLVKKYRRAK